MKTIIPETINDHNVLGAPHRVLGSNSNQKIFIEYIMLDGVIDQEENAHHLGELLNTFQVVKSLIFLIILKFLRLSDGNYACFLKNR